MKKVRGWLELYLWMSNEEQRSSSDAICKYKGLEDKATTSSNRIRIDALENTSKQTPTSKNRRH